MDFVLFQEVIIMIYLTGLPFLRTKYLLFLFRVSIGYLVTLMLLYHIDRKIEVARCVLVSWYVCVLSGLMNSSFLHNNTSLHYKGVRTWTLYAQ